MEVFSELSAGWLASAQQQEFGQKNIHLIGNYLLRLQYYPDVVDVTRIKHWIESAH